jgi:hypothetical protein
MNLREKISQAPWKEFMIGEGILSLGFGFVLLIFAFTSPDVVYEFIQNLNQAQVKKMLQLSAELIISAGLLLIGLPLLVFSCQILLASTTKKEKSM